MTRKEIIDLLEVISGAYPFVKISDPAAMVNAWMLIFGNYEAGAVYQAARLHIETSKYFPTPADIKTLIVKAEMIYKPADPMLLQVDNKILLKPVNNSDDLDDFLNNLWSE